MLLLLCRCSVYYRAAYDTNVALDAEAAGEHLSFTTLDGASVSPITGRVRRHFPETWLWLNEMTQYI